MDLGVVGVVELPLVRITSYQLLFSFLKERESCRIR